MKSKSEARKLQGKKKGCISQGLIDIENTKEFEGNKINKNSNTLEIKSISSQLVPRGIASRTCGICEFLSTLKRGLVIRLHHPKVEATFAKIISIDGGDTFKYTYVSQDEANIALKEQYIRFNRYDEKKIGAKGMQKSMIGHWHTESKGSLCDYDVKEIHKFSLPDHVAAEKYRVTRNRSIIGLKGEMMEIASRATHSGIIKLKDIAAVHPASHPDPYGTDGDHGSFTLRESLSKYNKSLTFSLVKSIGNCSLESESERWNEGTGSKKSFRYFDIEAATDGEFWFIFRGLLLLQRDALSGRFAVHRAAGFSSSYYNHEDENQKGKTRETSLKACIQFNEPEENDWPYNIFKRVCSTFSLSKQNIEEINIIKPPPSDYFLGFKSSGTKIWSRLRQAGLDTQRIYSLDTAKVVIKVRCPLERMMDVAEVLWMNMKTDEGE